MELYAFQAKTNHILKAIFLLLFIFVTTASLVAQDRVENPDDVATIDA